MRGLVSALTVADLIWGLPLAFAVRLNLVVGYIRSPQLNCPSGRFFQMGLQDRHQLFKPLMGVGSFQESLLLYVPHRQHVRDRKGKGHRVRREPDIDMKLLRRKNLANQRLKLGASFIHKVGRPAGELGLKILDCLHVPDEVRPAVLVQLPDPKAPLALDSDVHPAIFVSLDIGDPGISAYEIGFCTAPNFISLPNQHDPKRLVFSEAVVDQIPVSRFKNVQQESRKRKKHGIEREKR